MIPPGLIPPYNPYIDIAAPNPAQLGQALIEAVINNNIELFDQLIHNPNIPASFINTALIQSVIHNRNECFNTIIQEFEITAYTRSTAVEKAVEHHRANLFQVLYEGHEEEISPVSRGQALIRAITDNQAFFFESLIMGPPLCPFFRNHALQNAMSFDRLEFFQALHNLGDLTPDYRGQLVEFTINNNFPIYTHLLLNGDPIEPFSLATAIFHAIHLDRSVDVLAALVDYQPMSPDERGVNLIHTINFNRLELFNILLNGHVIPAAVRGQAVVLTARNNQAEMFNSLLVGQVISNAHRAAAILEAINQQNIDFLHTLRASGPISLAQRDQAILRAGANVAILEIINMFQIE